MEIAGLKGKAPRLAGWKMQIGRVSQVALHVGDDAPDKDDDKLSDAQKAAIITTSLIVFVVMLILSLSLLPPAPPIP